MYLDLHTAELDLWGARGWCWALYLSMLYHRSQKQPHSLSGKHSNSNRFTLLFVYVKYLLPPPQELIWSVQRWARAQTLHVPQRLGLSEMLSYRVTAEAQTPQNLLSRMDSSPLTGKGRGFFFPEMRKLFGESKKPCQPSFPYGNMFGIEERWKLKQS